MAKLRDKRKEFKEYANKNINTTLFLTLEYPMEFARLNIEAMIEDFLNTISMVVLLNMETSKLYEKFVKLYSRQFMYQRFLQIWEN